MDSIKHCNLCKKIEGLVNFSEIRKKCNICRRKSKNILSDYNHNYYLLNIVTIAKQQKNTEII